ncbi:MAG TPA: chemotaxis protein CheA [Desulfovibrio sp.]|jgi:two-component system chemotaxis sensor kinase CheA|nr:chemotaxis protein CheA [Desulfovibrio sp.]HBR06096.1 chemotaxis protein CheA [Desulfovibrio sp.]
MQGNDEVRSLFEEESRERLAAIERGLLDLEKHGADADQAMIHGIFREAHSVKAGANLLGLKSIESLAHKLENVLEMIRRGELTPTGRIVSILLEGLDALQDLLEDLDGSESRDISRPLERLARVESLRR